MKLIDIFIKKVRDEKKKYGWRKLPDYVITSEFLRFFSNEELREKIYASSYVTNRENYNALIELYKINKDYAIESVRGNIVSQEEIPRFRELNKYGLDFYICYYDGIKILEYKNKYGDIVIPYLKNDYDLYSELLLKSFGKDLDLRWCLENPKEFIFRIDNVKKDILLSYF